MSNKIESLLKEDRVFEPNKDFSKQSAISSEEQYEKLYKQSIEDPETFWAEQAKENISWFSTWSSVCEYDFRKIGTGEEPYVQYFKDATLNVSYNCIDRHIENGKGDKAALVWQGEKDSDKQTLSYSQLHKEVCRFSNVLKKHGVEKGTVVTIYMPMILQAPIAMLACARIGAIHSVVFSAFSADALGNRIRDCESEFVITSDCSYHAGKTSSLKEKVDGALKKCDTVSKVIVFNRGDSSPAMQEGRDFWWHEEIAKPDISDDCEPEAFDAETPLFALYTSGSTGKPKGVLHTSGGYLLWTHLTFKHIFDIKDEDVFWCTADVGWITGHSYLVYGPLSNGATNFMFEGVPTFPKPDRFWKLVEEYKVSIFYTAPTAIRALERLGDDWPNGCDLSSLRLLGSVGEPINPEAWMWYHRVIGKEKCPVVDTWWQTETGGIMITTLPGAIATKPGSAGKPFFGVAPEVRKEDGSLAKTNEGGYLVITKPWPGMIRGVYGDEKSELIKANYFSKFSDAYLSGDGCRVDSQGYHWLLGRIDDVINVSAHRFSTAEIESALVSHELVAEAAVVGCPHETKGQGIYCFVTLSEGKDGSAELRDELIKHVREEISPIATPEVIHFTSSLPKTRSGKIMRRVLRKIAEGDMENVGDVSTLADPSVVEALIKSKPKA